MTDAEVVQRREKALARVDDILKNVVDGSIKASPDALNLAEQLVHRVFLCDILLELRKLNHAED